MGRVQRLMAAWSGKQQRSIMDDLLAARRLNVIGSGSTAGVAVNNRTVYGVPAVEAAVNFASQAVASLTMGVWRGDGPIRERINTTWQARLFRGAPNPEQDWFLFWEIVESSLEYRSIAYIWKVKDADGKVVMFWALHPDQVYPQYGGRNNLTFQVTFTDGYPCPINIERYGSILGVDESTIIRVVGRGSLGRLIPWTPIQKFRSALGLAIAKQEHEAGLFERGASKSPVISFPAGVSAEQAKEWRELWDAEHAGPGNAGKTKVTGAGAQIQLIGMTQADAQFVESVGLSVMDVSRIFEVPSWFLGISDKTSKATKPEHEEQRWWRYLRPRLLRIEGALNADSDLNFLSSTDSAAFDTASLIRGDITTEATTMVQKVQSGIWLPDEARAKDGLPELPDGVGKIPQVTPVGGAPNPNNPAPAEEDDDEEE